MKLIIHISALLLRQIIKMGFSYKMIEDVDDFYYGSELFSSSSLVLFEDYDDSIVPKLCILRRSGCIHICMIHGCYCGFSIDSKFNNVGNIAARLMSSDIKLNIEGKVDYLLPGIELDNTAESISVEAYSNEVRRFEKYQSIFKQLFVDSFSFCVKGDHLTLRKEKSSGLGYYARDLINTMIRKWFSEEIVHVHGAESETVLNMLENKMTNVELYGLPNIEDDEFLVFQGKMEGSLQPKYGLHYSYFVYQVGEYANTNVEFDIGNGKGKNILVQELNYKSGYRAQIVEYNERNRLSYCDVVKDGDRLYGVLATRGRIITDFNELKKLYELYQFRSLLCRYFINKMNLFDDVSPNLKIGLFCVTNVMNFVNFRDKKLPDNFIFTAISEEANQTVGLDFEVKLESNYQFKYVSENGFEDFLVDNSVMYSLGYDFMSFKDFECYVMPVKYISNDYVDLSLNSKLLFRWGFGFNNLNFKFQTFYNSPSILIKSMSMFIRDAFKFTDDELHLRRFKYIQEKYKEKGIKLFYHKPGQWSLCYFKKGGVSKFVDVSGHMVNLILLSCYMIVNLKGYERIKMNNAMHPLLLNGETYNGLNYDRIEDINTNSESREVGLWHTKEEDLNGIEFAVKFSKEIGLKQNFIGWNYKVFRRMIDNISYGGQMSMPMVHDMGLSLKKYYSTYLK